MGRLVVGLARAQRVAQCSSVSITTKAPLPMQVWYGGMEGMAQKIHITCLRTLLHIACPTTLSLTLIGTWG